MIEEIIRGWSCIRPSIAIFLPGQAFAASYRDRAGITGALQARLQVARKDSAAQPGKAGALPLDPTKSDARLRATAEPLETIT
jgi:hypothetical protein